MATVISLDAQALLNAILESNARTWAHELAPPEVQMAGSHYSNDLQPVGMDCPCQIRIDIYADIFKQRGDNFKITLSCTYLAGSFPITICRWEQDVIIEGGNVMDHSATWKFSDDRSASGFAQKVRDIVVHAYPKLWESPTRT